MQSICTSMGWCPLLILYGRFEDSSINPVRHVVSVGSSVPLSKLISRIYSRNTFDESVLLEIADAQLRA